MSRFFRQKWLQLLTRIIKILAHWVQQTDRLPNYDCKKAKFDSGSSLLWGISRGDTYVTFFTPISCFPHFHDLRYEYLTPLYTTWMSSPVCMLCGLLIYFRNINRGCYYDEKKTVEKITRLLHGESNSTRYPESRSLIFEVLRTSFWAGDVPQSKCLGIDVLIIE